MPSFWFNHAVELFCVPTIVGPAGEAAVPVILTSPRRPAGALRVVSVWGMGGMGKSSLVWAVHNDPVLLDEFDCGAWVTVPHPLDNPEVFRRRLRRELGVARNKDLGQHLREKRYRVIVDDVLTCTPTRSGTLYARCSSSATPKEAGSS